MRVSRLIACAWPGLLSLWFGGAFTGLFHAVCFGTVLNLAIWAQWGRPDLFSVWLRFPFFAGIFCWWVFAAKSQWQSLFTGPKPKVQQETVALFQHAQTEYLKGRWFEARTLLEQLLQLDEDDPEARLLLATLLRHRGDASGAQMHLQQLRLSERALGWRFEIQRERELVNQILQQPVEEGDLKKPHSNNSHQSEEESTEPTLGNSTLNTASFNNQSDNSEAVGGDSSRQAA
jgi:hypothetical protein